MHLWIVYVVYWPHMLRSPSATTLRVYSIKEYNNPASLRRTYQTNTTRNFTTYKHNLLIILLWLHQEFYNIL